MAFFVCGNEGEEFGDEVTVDLEEGGAGDPVSCVGDGVVEAGCAPGGTRAGGFSAAAAVGGGEWEEGDAGAGEFEDLGAEGLAEGGECGG